MKKNLLLSTNRSSCELSMCSTYVETFYIYIRTYCFGMVFGMRQNSQQKMAASDAVTVPKVMSVTVFLSCPAVGLLCQHSCVCIQETW